MVVGSWSLYHPRVICKCGTDGRTWEGTETTTSTIQKRKVQVNTVVVVPLRHEIYGTSKDFTQADISTRQKLTIVVT